MNQESFAKTTRWMLYLSVAVLLIGLFSLLFVSKGDRQGTAWGTMMDGSRGNIPVHTEEENDGTSIPEGMMKFAVPMQGGAGVSPGASKISARKIAKNGSLSLIVENADWTADRVDSIAMSFGGFTVSRSLSDSSDVSPYPMMGRRMMYDAALDKEGIADSTSVRSGTVVISVPAENFSSAMSEIKKIARVVTNDSISAEDVTSAYVDLEARLNNKRAEEAAFAKILNENAQRTSDILEVTRELSRVRGEIEQLEAQKKMMDSQTDMSQITISLSEDAKIGSISNVWRPWQIVKDATNELILHVQRFIEGAIYFIVSVLPFFLLYLLGLYLLFLVGRRMYRKMIGG